MFAHDGESRFGGAFTSSTGDYEITGLPPDRYSVRFETVHADESLVPEYWRDAFLPRQAELVRVRADQATTGIDASLTSRNELGAIDGTVVSTYESISLSGAFIEAKSNSTYSQSVSNSSGRNEIPELPAGDYTVTFRPGDGHLDVHFDSTSLELATRTIGLDPGVSVKDGDARLLVGGLIGASIEVEHPIDGES